MVNLAASCLYGRGVRRSLDRAEYWIAAAETALRKESRLPDLSWIGAGLQRGQHWDAVSDPQLAWVRELPTPGSRVRRRATAA